MTVFIYPIFLSTWCNVTTPGGTVSYVKSFLVLLWWPGRPVAASPSHPLILQSQSGPGSLRSWSLSSHSPPETLVW